MEKVKGFLKKKDIVFSVKRYGIDALGAMAQGLFCTLLIGTILNTLGNQFGVPFLKAVVATVNGTDYTVGGLASAMAGPAMAVAIGYALKAPQLVLFSLITVGFAANALGGAGGPLAVYFIADSVAAVALILWTFVRHFDGRDYIYVLAIEISIIVMTVVPLAIANSISYKNDYEKRNELANLKLQAQRADIIRMDKEYQDIRKIRHDMVKHLNIYMHLLNDGDYEGLRQAIGEHIEDCGQNKYVYVAGNNLVNSVLNEKKVLCEHENIKMQVEVTASVDGERELDIAVMLSNLLDNAVEAQKKITPDKPRSIFLKIFSYENKYSILIKNTVAKSVLQNNPRFITDKANRYLHGIGMKSIEHTVDKNGGYIQRYEEDGMFCVHILL